MRLTETKDGTIIDVFVKTNQPRFKLAIDGENLLVCSTEAPVRGKVNKELIKELSRLFRAKVELVSGSTSRQKKLIVKGVGKAEVEQLVFRSL
jgi:uncharacterized protein (TIGR00251 family)